MARQAAPVVRRGLHREVVHQLGLRVIRGELAPGETLPDEAALGEQFGVSRTVLREAIKVLAAKGLLESRPRIGTRVRPRHGWNLLDPDVLAWRFEAGPDEAFLREITEVRRIIEPAAAGLAAERATADEVAAIVAICERLEAAAAEDGEEYIDVDMVFHMAILDAAHNDLLAQLGDAIAVALRISRRLTITLPGSSLGGMPTHWGVTKAIRGRDPCAADQAMRALISHTAGDIDRALHRSGQGGSSR